MSTYKVIGYICPVSCPRLLGTTTSLEAAIGRVKHIVFTAKLGYMSVVIKKDERKYLEVCESSDGKRFGVHRFSPALSDS